MAEDAVICIVDKNGMVFSDHVLYVEKGSIETLGVMLLKQWNSSEKAKQLVAKNADVVKVLDYPNVERDSNEYRDDALEVSIKGKSVLPSYYSYKIWLDVRDKPVCYLVKHAQNVYYWDGVKWNVAIGTIKKRGYANKVGQYVDTEFGCVQMPLKLAVSPSMMEGRSTRAPRKKIDNKPSFCQLENSVRKMF